MADIVQFTMMHLFLFELRFDMEVYSIQIKYGYEGYM